VPPLQYPQGWLKQELENDSKDQRQHDLARDKGCGQQRKDEETTKEYCFRISGQRVFLRLSCRRHDFGLLIGTHFVDD
jgi:hypothetical protein